MKPTHIVKAFPFPVNRLVTIMHACLYLTVQYALYVLGDNTSNSAYDIRS